MRVGQGRAAKHHQIDQLFADVAIGVLRHTEVPTGGHRDTHLGAHPVGPPDHEADFFQWGVDHLVGVEAEREIGEVEAVRFHHLDRFNSVVELGAGGVQVIGAEALDAVRAVWPEKYPLTMRLGADDLNPAGTQFDDAIEAIKMMKAHGLDLADLSLGFNTDEMIDSPMKNVGFMVERAHRVRTEVGIPVATSWNLGVPQNADRYIRDELIDLVMLGRPALANPHWPVWAARELGHESPFSLVQSDWRWWLENFRGHAPSIGWPEVQPLPAPGQARKAA